MRYYTHTVRPPRVALRVKPQSDMGTLKHGQQTARFVVHALACSPPKTSVTLAKRPQLDTFVGTGFARWTCPRCTAATMARRWEVRTVKNKAAKSGFETQGRRIRRTR